MGTHPRNDCYCDSFFFLSSFILLCFVSLGGTCCHAQRGISDDKTGDLVYYLVQPITALPFIKLLLLMTCYCVPVLVSLGCMQIEVLLVTIVDERMLACGMMGNANVGPSCVRN